MLPRRDGPQPGDFGAGLRDFRKDGAGPTGDVDQRSVERLVAIQQRSPYPIGKAVGTVADCLPHHRPVDAPGLGKIAIDIDDIAGGGLEYPGVAPQKATIQIVQHRALGGVEVLALEIPVPADDIEFLCGDAVIEIVVLCDEVGRHDLVCAKMRSHRIDLVLLITAPEVAPEPPPVERQPRIVARPGNVDLRPVVVGLAPIGSEPRSIQAVDRAVSRLQPLLESGPRLAVAGVAAIFVVDLETDDVRVVAVSPRHFTGDPGGFPAVQRASHRKLATPAVPRALARRLDQQGLGIFRGEPGGWPRRRRAEQDLDMVRRGMRDRAVEPAKVIDALARLHPAPGELAHPDEGDAGGSHPGEIGVPAVLAFLLGIPGHAERKDRLGQRRTRGRSGRPADRDTQHEERGDPAKPAGRADLHQRGPSRAEAPSINLPAKVRTSGGSSGSSMRSISIDTAASVIRRTGWRIVDSR